MILLLALLFLFRHNGTSAAPVTASFAEPSAYNATLFIRDDPTDACSGRSFWDILWSCLATTFAVTWVSVHPNVPFLEESDWHLLKRRIFLMCLAFLAPEVMIMWAFKQWRGAVMIKTIINGARPKSYSIQWTMTHAHFLQMGGFKVNHQGENGFWTFSTYTYNKTKKGLEVQESTLDFDKFQELLHKQLIKFPETTAIEIQDRSKSNALTKGIALLQISWFLLQLIARAHQHLDITEIELTTAALAGMNSIMYLFWWNKPFDIRCPIIIRTKRLERRLVKAGNAKGTVERTKWLFLEDENGDHVPEDFDLTSHLAERVRSTVRTILYRVSETQEEPTPRPIRAALNSDNNSENSADPQSPKSIWTCCKSVVTKLLYVPNLLMFVPVSAILRPSRFPPNYPFKDVKDKLENTPSLQLLFEKTDMGWIMGMMFYSEDADTKPLLIFSALVGAAFGSIHCAAWNFDFPSSAEKVLWRTASLTVVGNCLSIIVGIPLHKKIFYMTLSAVRQAKGRHDEDQRLPIGERQGVEHAKKDAKVRMWKFMQTTLETIPAIIYPLARLFLLALSLSSLRDLRGSALETVTWTKFIPHI